MQEDGAAISSHRIIWERSQRGRNGNPNSVNISLTTGETGQGMVNLKAGLDSATWHSKGIWSFRVTQEVGGTCLA